MSNNSIDVLAEAVRQRELSTKMVSPALLYTTSSKLSLPAQSNPILKALPSLPTVLSSNCSSNDGNHDFYLSLLQEQRRRASLAFMDSATGTISLAPDTALSTLPTTASSVSLNSASTMHSQFDSDITAPSRRRKPNFAEKLYAVLNNQSCRHAIAWLPSGRSFCIIDQEEFVKSVLPKYFREAKFESFQRRLKRWNFKKIYTTGAQQILFSHDMFHRDRPDLCKLMSGRGDKATACKTAAARGSKASSVSLEPQDQQVKARTVMLLQQAEALEQKEAIQKRASLLTTAQNQVQSPSPIVPNLPASQDFILQRRITSSSSSLSAHVQAAAHQPPKKLFQANANANAQFTITNLYDDIANCEQRLRILQQMKEREMARMMFSGGTSPSVSPS